MILDCNEIIPDRLWVGVFVQPEDVKILRQMGITTVINLQSDKEFTHHNVSVKKLLKAYGLADIELCRIPIPDFNQQALAEKIPNGVAEIEAALTPRWARVYMHCTAGINRGPTLAAAYLVKVRGLSAQEAYDYIVARRHCGPYLSLLEQYEAALRNQQSD